MGESEKRHEENSNLIKEIRASTDAAISKFMGESAKRHKENSNLIKEIRASTDAAIRNQGASIKTLEIQIGQISKELATVKYLKGIAENVLVGIGKFVFPVDFIILDMREDIKVPLILGRLFLSTAHAKIDVFPDVQDADFGKRSKHIRNVNNVPPCKVMPPVQVKSSSTHGMLSDAFLSDYSEHEVATLLQLNTFCLLVTQLRGAKLDRLYPIPRMKIYPLCFTKQMQTTTYEVVNGSYVETSPHHLVAYTSDGLRLIATKIRFPMMLDSYTNSMCLESWGRSSYARVLIEINACNDFSDNLVMVVPNLEVTGYTKETIRIEYEWKPPRCSTCLLFGHSIDDCPKAPKRVVNMMDKGKGQTSGADDDDFIKVKKKKSSGNNGSTKNFKSVSVKPKTQYRPKAKQSTEGTSNSPKTTGTNTASTSRYNKESPSNKEKRIMEGKLALVDDDGKPLEKVDYLVNSNSGDEVEPVENETANFLASKRVGYGPKSL
ncbi:ESKIMO 1-like protein [Tanacetum coccineum]